jgi:hypothetical protein
VAHGWILLAFAMIEIAIPLTDIINILWY